MNSPRHITMAALVALPTAAYAQPFAITTSSVSCGGVTTPVAAGPYTLACTIGDPLAKSTGAAGTYSLSTGFLAISTGGAPPCYPNCDASSGSPLLTANDFQCFLDRFAAANPYANCDGSTGTPSLTANDFQCFLNAYAAGCE